MGRAAGWWRPSSGTSGLPAPSDPPEPTRCALSPGSCCPTRADLYTASDGEDNAGGPGATLGFADGADRLGGDASPPPIPGAGELLSDKRWRLGGSDGRSRSFEDIAALEVASDEEEDEDEEYEGGAFSASMGRNGWPGPEGDALASGPGLSASRSSSTRGRRRPGHALGPARSEAPPRAIRVCSGLVAPAEPLHVRFQRRLAEEVETALARAADATGEGRVAPLRELYRNISAGIEPAVAARLRASGLLGRVPPRYFGLLAQYYAAQAEEGPELLERQRSLWLRLMSSDLFPAVWAALFHVWMLGGFDDLRLETAPPPLPRASEAGASDWKSPDPHPSKRKLAAEGSSRSSRLGRPGATVDAGDDGASDADDEADSDPGLADGMDDPVKDLTEQSPVPAAGLETGVGSPPQGGHAGNGAKTADAACSGASHHEEDEEPFQGTGAVSAAPGGTPATRIVSRRGRQSGSSAPGDDWLGASPAGTSCSAAAAGSHCPRTRECMELLISGCSRLFWSDAHAGTCAFGDIFAMCCAAVTSPTKLAGIPASQRRDLSAVVACHLLHYAPASGLRRVLACLPDLETGAMPSASRSAAADPRLSASRLPAALTQAPGVFMVDSGAASAPAGSDASLPRRRATAHASKAASLGKTHPASVQARMLSEGPSAADSPGWASGLGPSTVSRATDAAPSVDSLPRGLSAKLGDQAHADQLQTSHSTSFELPEWASGTLQRLGQVAGVDTDAGLLWVRETAGAFFSEPAASTDVAGDGSELAVRSGQFIEEAVVHLRALTRQDSTMRYLSGLRGLAGIPMRRAAANRLHSALHVFTTPGGPAFPSPETRAAASETIHVLFPRGWAVRRVVHLAFRLLHPVRAAYSLCNWTQRSAAAAAAGAATCAQSAVSLAVVWPASTAWHVATGTLRVAVVASSAALDTCLGAQRRAKLLS
ncbi:unnamed protein product [Symbiodinium sp. KB8]|nr:unnamed protein product [Symbiodinium sp. KB8]